MLPDLSNGCPLRILTDIRRNALKYALGLIEAIGLATAYEAADAAVKSANVQLLGFEPCRGNGMHTIKVIGDVGAVKAAVAAAQAAGSKGRGIFSAVVIARPSDGIMPLINNSATFGCRKQDQEQNSETEETAPETAADKKPEA
jgi:ethanolamine utilization protein EutM